MKRIIDTIGNTPLVEITHLASKNVKILAKLEGTNPGGSVKDRPALFMIQGAIRKGLLKPGIKLIEATSGNTGIALAMIAGFYNLDIELVMPEDSTQERVLAMQALGAHVILTPAEQSMEGARDYVEKKLCQGNYIMLDQFANPDNVLSHYAGTGSEIWRETASQVTHFVSAMGTTGTIIGVSKFLQEQSKEIQIIGVHPADNSSIPGIRRWAQEYLPKIYQPERVDRIETVTEDQARSMTRWLAKKEGIFCGMSSGGAVYAAMQIAKEIKKGIIVTIICDRGDRYLSSNLFA